VEAKQNPFVVNRFEVDLLELRSHLETPFLRLGVLIALGTALAVLSGCLARKIKPTVLQSRPRTDTPTRVFGHLVISFEKAIADSSPFLVWRELNYRL
jgi:hypothetical protein